MSEQEAYEVIHVRSVVATLKQFIRYIEAGQTLQRDGAFAVVPIESLPELLGILKTDLADFNRRLVDLDADK